MSHSSSFRVGVFVGMAIMFAVAMATLTVGRWCGVAVGLASCAFGYFLDTRLFARRRQTPPLHRSKGVRFKIR